MSLNKCQDCLRAVAAQPSRYRAHTFSYKQNDSAEKWSYYFTHLQKQGTKAVLNWEGKKWVQECIKAIFFMIDKRCVFGFHIQRLKDLEVDYKTQCKQKVLACLDKLIIYTVTQELLIQTKLIFTLKKTKTHKIPLSILNSTFNSYLYFLMIHHLHTLLKQRVIKKKNYKIRAFTF